MRLFWLLMLGSIILICAPSLLAVTPEVVGADEPRQHVDGLVFSDANGDGRHQSNEPGIAGVMVSNGLNVVVTDDEGRYRLMVRDDMDISVVQPSGWQVAMDANHVPRFHYAHRHGRAAPELRFGGLPDTGAAPAQVNFPLYPSPVDDAFRCAIIGDSQTSSNDEVGYFRDSTVADLLRADLGSGDCLIYVGDVVGDDLGLLDRLTGVAGVLGMAQWLVIGNHDLDLDAEHPADATATWRRIAAPTHYAFEIGHYTFVALNNIVYPCGEEDASHTGREHCLADQPRYNGRVDVQQMTWLANLLEHVDEDRTVVLLHHIPLVSVTDAQSPVHQTDNAADIHKLLTGRKALSISGHTHSLENLSPGEHYAGWADAVNVGPLPFRHIVAGASSGTWWQGDFDIHGVPMALQRMGAPRGVVMMDFHADHYRERFLGAGLPSSMGQWVDFSTPAFRHWVALISEWQQQSNEQRHPVPPLSVHDLPDTRMMTPEELEQGVYLVVNVWMGSAETTVSARINDAQPLRLQRSQDGAGGAVKTGVMQLDPFSLKRQMTVARTAIQSRLGEARSQGYESFQGRSYRGLPGPLRPAFDRNAHLWQVRLPADLPVGVHKLTITTTDRHGQEAVEHRVFEVHQQRPPRYWRENVWQGQD